MHRDWEHWGTKQERMGAKEREGELQTQKTEGGRERKKKRKERREEEWEKKDSERGSTSKKETEIKIKQHISMKFKHESNIIFIVKK